MFTTTTARHTVKSILDGAPRNARGKRTVEAWVTVRGTDTLVEVQNWNTGRSYCFRTHEALAASSALRGV